MELGSLNASPDTQVLGLSTERDPVGCFCCSARRESFEKKLRQVLREVSYL